MQADPARTVLVVGDRPQLWAALQERLDPRYVLVRWTTPARLRPALGACPPWPWSVAGEDAEAGASLVALARSRPLLLHWLGAPPAGMPGHLQAHRDWRALAAAIQVQLEAHVGELRLAPERGLRAPGRTFRSAELEALVAAYPNAIDVPLAAFRGATRVLRSNGIPWRVARAAAGVCLVPAPPGRSEAAPRVAGGPGRR